jgi:hypothetical protein
VTYTDLGFSDIIKRFGDLFNEVQEFRVHLLALLIGGKPAEFAP